MKRKHLLRAAASAVMLGSFIAMPLRASASSVEDVYDAMRRIGLPESMIQEAKIQYQNTQHDENGMSVNGQYFTYDVWADLVELYEDDIWNEVGKQFGISGDAIKQASQEQQAAQSAPAQQQQQQQQTPQSSAESAPAQSEQQPAATSAPQTQSVPQPEKPFVNMTLEEKQAYVASLPESERAAFIAGLSTTERNSIIKQMSTDSQASLASGFIELGEHLGMHISVDQLDGNGINYSVRNSDGTLIDVSSVGTSVDDTGWNTTLPVLGGVGLVFGAAGGISLLFSGMRRKEHDA